MTCCSKVHSGSFIDSELSSSRCAAHDKGAVYTNMGSTESLLSEEKASPLGDTRHWLSYNGKTYVINLHHDF